MSIVRQLGASPALVTLITVAASLLAPACVAYPTESSPSSGGEIEPNTSTCPSSSTPTVGGDSLFAVDSNVSPALAVTPATLFWLDRGPYITDSIQALPLSGAPATTLYVASPDATAAIEDLVSDGTNVYFAQVTNNDGQYSSTIESIPVGGGTATVLTTVDTYVLNLSIAGEELYFTDGSTLQIVAKKGGSPSIVSGSQGGIAASGTAVFFTNVNGALAEIPSVGTPSSVLVDHEVTQNDALLTTLVANDSQLFWPCQDDSGGLLCAAAIRGGNGTAQILTTLDLGSSELTADDSSVYFVDTSACTSWLGKVPVGGGAAVTLATGFGHSSEPSTAHAVAVDDTYVYWTSPGEVLRAAK